MKRFALSILGLAAAAATLVSCSSDEKKAEVAPAAEAPLTVERNAQIKVTAYVRAVNHDTRVITIADRSTEASETFVVGPQVRRLNEVNVGDEVTLEANARLIAELRPPTSDERAHPISAITVSGRAPMSDEPAAGAATGVKVVTTVEAIDIPNMRVTLKGPLGDSTTVRARSPENIRKLHVGDTIVLTYTQATVIALDKRKR